MHASASSHAQMLFSGRIADKFCISIACNTAGAHSNTRHVAARERSGAEIARRLAFLRAFQRMSYCCFADYSVLGHGFGLIYLCAIVLFAGDDVDDDGNNESSDNNVGAGKCECRKCTKLTHQFHANI